LKQIVKRKLETKKKKGNSKRAEKTIKKLIDQ
jgi:hypothetical protein